MTTMTLDDVQDRLREDLAALLPVTAAEIEPGVPLWDYGLDSVTTAVFVARLEHWSGVKLDMLDLFDHPTLVRLATHLSSLAAATR